MKNLRGSERFIINNLFDYGIFTSTVTDQTSQAKADAVMALRQPATQQRLHSFLVDLVGLGPTNFQENLVFLSGEKRLPAETTHVLLATIKAVINLPELQNTQTDRVIAVRTVVRQVHSEVVELNEKEIRSQIIALFVDRFGLFVEDEPEQGPEDQAQEIEEYWSVSPDFAAVAQCLVNRIQMRTDRPTPSAVQQINQTLLSHDYLSAASPLWPELVKHKEMIAAQWQQTDRFVLECGDNYAVLLDKKRSPSTAKPFVIAIGVAQSLGIGVPSAQLLDRIHEVAAHLIPGYPINVSLVKEALYVNGLAHERDGYVVATPLVKRFGIKQAEGEA